MLEEGRAKAALGNGRLGGLKGFAGAVPLALTMALVAAGCASSGSGRSGVDENGAGEQTTALPSLAADTDAGADGTIGSEPLSAEAVAAGDAFVTRVAARIYDPVNGIDPAVAFDLGVTGDDRLAWLIADGLRFVGRGPEFDAMVEAGSALGGIELSTETAWLELNNHLLMVDRPAPPGYREWKRDLYVAVDATWAPFFEDVDADIDWRLISFGGVLADRRPFGSDDTCQCIAALDDPSFQVADEVDWLNDGDPVIGVTVNGQSRAYPLHIMETHELVNDELGDRRIALAYCTLCGSGQAYVLDSVPDRFQPVVLRTSGLLNRSNKIMFDLTSRSMVDTFSGEARTGPWREAGVELEQIATVTSLWGDWKAANPDTTLMNGLDGNGAEYPLDPLGGRDDGGPIFPIGQADDRLFPQTNVIGVTTGDGRSLAFPVVESRDALRRGDPVSLDGVTLQLDGSGLRAVDGSGQELVAHQAFWFAWSQFNPDTGLWTS